MNRVFVLSPANCNGVRARWLLSKTGQSDLAQRLRSFGAPLGEVFTFLSALYFRGKLTYAEAFCRPPFDCPGIFIITPSDGLMPPRHFDSTAEAASIRPRADSREQPALLFFAATERQKTCQPNGS
jgi:hypothetical protein